MSAAAFCLFLLVIAIEYLGIISNYLPFLRGVPIALGSCFLLVLYLSLKENALKSLRYPEMKLLLCILFLSFLGVLHGLIKLYAIDVIKQQVGYLVLAIITFAVINSVQRFRIYSAFIVAIHCFLVVTNSHKLFQAREGSFKAGYFIGDGNDLAWSLLVTLPLAMYMLVTSKGKLKTVIFGVATMLIIVGILGTQSRGAAIGLALSGGFMFFKILSEFPKIRRALLVPVIIGAFFLPAAYLDRLGTVANYEEDTSAMGRIAAWGTAIEMANDNFLGVGPGSFNSAYGRSYRKPDDPVRWISTHSIYFKVLAEYGYIGLICLLMVIYKAFSESSRHIKRILATYGNDNEYILPMKFLMVMVIGYAVPGIFLTGVNYPHVYIMVGLIAAMRHHSMEQYSKLSIPDKRPRR